MDVQKPMSDGGQTSGTEGLNHGPRESRLMSDDDDEEAPSVELGDAEAVDGAPLARVASRLHWGMAKSEIVRREGETTVRTPNGPTPLSAVLDDVDVPYFESRREFVTAVRDQTGIGPIPTSERSEPDGPSERD